jgi:hypothetical protein
VLRDVLSAGGESNRQHVDLVKARVDELKAEKAAAQAALAALPTDAVAPKLTGLAARLSKLPDRSEQLRAVPPELQGKVIQASACETSSTRPPGRSTSASKCWSPWPITSRRCRRGL